MRILLIGDFGGAFPDSLYQKLKSEEYDYVLCDGDFSDIKEIRDLFFKHGKKYKEMYSEKELDAIRVKGIEKAKPVCKKLNSLGKPVLFVAGNNERKKYDLFLEIVKEYENLHNVDRSFYSLGDITVYGYHNRESTAVINENENISGAPIKELKEKAKEKLLILTHYPPFNCPLDKLPADNPVNPNGHIGSKVVRKIIDDIEPRIVICGHLEEYQDKCKIGKTEVINPGGADEGKYAILEFDNKCENYCVTFKQVK